VEEVSKKAEIDENSSAKEFLWGGKIIFSWDGGEFGKWGK